MNQVLSRTEILGYAHARYAGSLREFGEPRELPRCGGWIIVRPIPGTPFKDATGCYPLFCCRNWRRLHEDLRRIGTDIVSLVLVADPFSGIDKAYLEHCFDFVRPFKTHYLTELMHPLENVVSRNYRYNVRKSLKAMDVEICSQPAKYLSEWVRLYDNLIRRHDIKGISAFSRASFAKQLNVPGMVMVLGRSGGEIVGATLVLISGQVAYSHLSACSSTGYKIQASYGITWTALSYLRDRGIRYFDNGGSAGIKEEYPLDGLAQFKKGWSNNKNIVTICGRVFDRKKYDFLSQRQTGTDSVFFPAYRSKEQSKSWCW